MRSQASVDEQFLISESAAGLASPKIPVSTISEIHEVVQGQIQIWKNEILYFSGDFYVLFEVCV